MGTVKLLDCTLRDGGYVNDWRFGRGVMEDIIRRMGSAGIEIIELGFLREEPYHPDRSVFNSMNQVRELIGKKQPGVLYSVMCEISNPFPLEKLPPADAGGADIIRVIIWKTRRNSRGEFEDALEDSYAYCKGIAERGYRLYVQPARVDQYSDTEFTGMVRRFSQLNPAALYVVDSWGTQNPEDLLHYMRLADQCLPEGTLLGCHGHNNLMQALSAAQAAIHADFRRGLVVDASAYGIGRGAGNLNLEIIAKYMNERCGKSYALPPILEVCEKYILDICRKHPWGYSIPLFLTAEKRCNPDYGPYLSGELGMSAAAIAFVLEGLSEEDKIIFRRSFSRGDPREPAPPGGAQLLDCTLSIGGKLISWAYGETVITQMRNQLSASGVEILELGLLRSTGYGPERSVYTTPYLPAGFTRGKGQLCSFLMDQHRIPLSDLPERGPATADMIRVSVAAEDAEETLRYCGGLRDKGYLVSILIEETGQYTHKQLRRLLHMADRLSPWACTIVDTSGILDRERLGEVFSLFHKTLRDEIRIGFHTCDNLEQSMELAESLCMIRGKRGLCLDVSTDGMGPGALHLSARALAEWMNKTFAGRYNLPALELAEQFVEPYVSLKKTPGARFAYHTSASHNCHFRYVEYYMERMKLDTGVIDAILPELPEENRLRFSETAARQAMRAYRKKQLNLLIALPTCGRSAAVDALLFAAANELEWYGIDILIYDSSGDTRTEAVTRNFQFEGYENILYKRYEGPFDGFSLDRKMASVCREALSYDYVWILRDSVIPSIAPVYHQLLEMTMKGTDILVLDTASQNEGRSYGKEYRDCREFFRENAGRMAVPGGLVLRTDAVREMLGQAGQDGGGFWHMTAPLRLAAKGGHSMGLIVADAWYANPMQKAPPFHESAPLERWGRAWCEAVSALPAVYDSEKESVLRIQLPNYFPFSFLSLLKLRGNHEFDPRLYREYRAYMEKVGCTSPGKRGFAARCPRPLARFIVRRASLSAAVWKVKSVLDKAGGGEG